MSARDEILTRVRRSLPQSSPLPSLDRHWIRYEDPFGQFATTLEGVGGVCHRVASAGEATELLQHHAPYRDAGRVCTFVDGVGHSSFDVAAIGDPHDVEEVDFAILPGEVAVAENAAVWVSTNHLVQRTLYFIAQHVALVVPARRLVHSMHEAYRQIDVRRDSFGTFISGPSKTADIEQSLVIGAHGARSLLVFLIDEVSDDGRSSPD